MYPWASHQYPPEVSDAAKELRERMFGLGQRLLRSLDSSLPSSTKSRLREQKALGPLDSLAGTLSSEASLFRILHYPSERYLTEGNNTEKVETLLKQKKIDPLALRAAAHTDINYLTILPAGSIGGLQVRPRDPETGEKSSEWWDVPHETGSIVVNIGDMLEEMTDKTFQSTEHRVLRWPSESDEDSEYLDPDEERMSCPLFLHADPGTSPYSEKYETALEHLVERLSAINAGKEEDI